MIRVFFETWYFRKVSHGPETWPWWKLIGLRYIVIHHPRADISMRRLWVYTQHRGAWSFDVTINWIAWSWRAITHRYVNTGLFE